MNERSLSGVIKSVVSMNVMRADAKVSYCTYRYCHDVVTTGLQQTLDIYSLKLSKHCRKRLRATGRVIRNQTA